MKVKDATLKFIRDLITGDSGITPYKSGPLLVEFFNKFGFNCQYGPGFPSRWSFTEENLKILNEENRMDEVLNYYFDPVNWIEKEQELDELLKKLNKYLYYDGYEIILKDKEIKIYEKKVSPIKVTAEKEITQETIKEDLKKCEDRLSQKDYSGTITSCRTFLEGLLIFIFKKQTGVIYNFDGNLPKLFKDVLKILKVTNDSDSSQSFKKIVNGLLTTIQGFSELSNIASDRHGNLKKESLTKENVTFVVNVTKSLADFLFHLANFKDIQSE
mgnify:CR=1 FL=1